MEAIKTMVLSLIIASATARIITSSISNETSSVKRYTKDLKFKLPPLDDFLVTRNKRSASSPFVRDEKCKISYQEMTSIADLLKMYANGQATADVPFSAATTGLNTCQQAMQEIKTTANKLINISNQIKSSGNSISTDEYMKLRNALEETNSKFQQQLNHVKQQATQDAQLQIKEVESEKQKMKFTMEKLLQDLNISVTAHQSDILELAASEIDSGNYDNAVKKFLQLKDNRLLTEVIKRAFKLKNTVNIMYFLEKLPWLIHRAKGYLTVLDLILAGNHHTSPLIMIIHGNMQEYLKMENKNDPAVWAESKPYFDDIQRKLKKPVAEIMHNWVQLIRTKNTQQLQHFSLMFPTAFPNIVADLVKLAYRSDDSTIDALFKFADDLPGFHASTIAYTALFEVMSVTLERALRITYKIHELKNMKNFANASEDTKKRVNSLWNSLPEAVKPIVTGENVCIRNHGSTLYVKDHYDSERDDIRAKPYPSGISSKWKFEREEDNQKFLFRIKSHPYGDYLYSASDYFNIDSSRRRVFTWRSSIAVHQGSWKLEDFDWRSGSFYLYNTYQREYLNVNSDDRVYTHRSGGRGSNAVWKVSSC